MSLSEPSQTPIPSPRRRRWYSRVFWTASDVYSGGGALYLLLKLFFGDRLWPVAAFDNLAGWYLIPALPLLALAAWRRNWRSAAPLAIATAGFVWLFGDLFLPRVPPQTACASAGDGCVIRLKVMAFNLLGDARDYTARVDEIRRQDADIVAIEEYPQRAADQIAAALSDVYPYRVHYRDDIPGVGLISKYPIVSAENLAFGDDALLTHVRAVIDVNGVKLTVYVAHVSPPAFGRDEGAPTPYLVRGSADAAALAKLAAADAPALVMGDFNMADISDDYRVMQRAGLVDAFREGGYGFGATWPVSRRGRSANPIVRIDYIWHTGEFAVEKAWVGGPTGSDHLPVIAELVWKDGKK